MGPGLENAESMQMDARASSTPSYSQIPTMILNLLRVMRGNGLLSRLPLLYPQARAIPLRFLRAQTAGISHFPLYYPLQPCVSAVFIDDHRASAHTRSGEYKRQCGVCLGPLRALGQDFRSRAGGVAPPCRTLIVLSASARLASTAVRKSWLQSIFR